MQKHKLLLPLAGRPVIAWTLEAALRSQRIKWIGIVGQEVDREAILAVLDAPSKPVHWIQGGSTRQESVLCGLAGLPEQARHVLIHDGARCLAEPELFDRCAAVVEDGEPRHIPAIDIRLGMEEHICDFHALMRLRPW